MVRAVLPTPPSPSTTILCGVVNLPAIVVFVGREAREGPGVAVWSCEPERLSAGIVGGGAIAYVWVCGCGCVCE